jgi:hypothetical protein
MCEREECSDRLLAVLNATAELFRLERFPVALCGCETVDSYLREEHKSQVYENKGLSKM